MSNAQTERANKMRREKMLHDLEQIIRKYSPWASDPDIDIVEAAERMGASYAGLAAALEPFVEGADYIERSRPNASDNTPLWALPFHMYLPPRKVKDGMLPVCRLLELRRARAALEKGKP